MEQRVSKLENDMVDVKMRLAIAETNIKEIYKTLDKISNNTTWILRIIVGAIVGVLLGFAFKGGF